MTREVIESFGVAETLFLSGARATFTMKRGARLSKTKIAEAFAARNMKLEIVRYEMRPRPEVCYVATVTGLG